MSKLVKDLISLFLECCPLLHPKTSVEKQVKLNKLLEPFQVESTPFRHSHLKRLGSESFISQNPQSTDKPASVRDQIFPSQVLPNGDTGLGIRSKVVCSMLDHQYIDSPEAKDRIVPEEADENSFDERSEVDQNNYFKKQYKRKPNISGYFSTTNCDSPLARRSDPKNVLSGLNFDSVVRSHQKVNAQVQTDTTIINEEKLPNKFPSNVKTPKTNMKLQTIVTYSSSDPFGREKHTNSEINFFLKDSVRVKAKIPEAKLLSARTVMEKKLEFYRGSNFNGSPSPKNYKSQVLLQTSSDQNQSQNHLLNVSLRDVINKEENFDQESIHKPRNNLKIKKSK